MLADPGIGCSDRWIDATRRHLSEEIDQLRRWNIGVCCPHLPQCASKLRVRGTKFGEGDAPTRRGTFRFHKSLSQPEPGACSKSFMRMNKAARLTGSSSPSAAWNALSYSSLCQRVMLRPL